MILTLSKVSCYIHLKRRWNQFLLIQKSILHWRLYNLLYFLVSTAGWVLLVRFLWSSSVLFFITMVVIWSSEFRFDFSHVAVSDSWTILHEVVGTVEGGRAPTKIKTDLKKPIVNLACHPRLPVLVRCLCSWFFSLFMLVNILLWIEWDNAYPILKIFYLIFWSRSIEANQFGREKCMLVVEGYTILSYSKKLYLE